MHRIDHTTANPTPPTPETAGAPGYFRKGDPQAGQEATTVTPDWANAVQEELAYVITQSGLALSKTDNTQLRQAILKLVQDSNSAVIITGAVFEASVTNGEVVRWDAGNSRFDEAIADGTANNQAVGIADVTNSKVYCYGETPALFSGLTPGGKYYLSAATPGAITTTAPSDAVAVGISKSATVLFVDIDVAPAATISGKNLIINGNFAINQRAYVSGTATTAANQYTLDRWRVVTSGQNLTFAASGNGNIVTAPAGGIEQVIEGANIEGGIHTLSWAGTATATVNGAAISNGGQTAALTAGANATIKFSSGTVSKVQFEKGIATTPFENLILGHHLALCQRYFERLSYSTAPVWAPYWFGIANSVSMTQWRAQINLSTPKRAPYSVTLSAPGTFDIMTIGQAFAVDGISAGEQSPAQFVAYGTTSAAINQVSLFLRASAGARIDVDAEL